jgi:transposase
MQTVTTIGLDIAKSVFQVHGVDAAGQVVVRRQLKRRYVLAFFEKLPPCLIGVEACASSHHWSRELRALGHKVRLMPPAYVRPYVKRQSPAIVTTGRRAIRAAIAQGRALLRWCRCGRAQSVAQTDEDNPRRDDDSRRSAELWDIQVKGVNYLLVAHAAGLVTVLTLLKDYPF